MPNVVILSIAQTSTTNNGTVANVVIEYNIQGPLTEVDFVQLYAVSAAAADPSIVSPADFVQDFDVTPPEPSYTKTFQLAAGSIYTIFLCPRTGSQDDPDDEINGDYWEDSCVFKTFATTAPGPSGRETWCPPRSLLSRLNLPA
jgi:hypothetical protein